MLTITVLFVVSGVALSARTDLLKDGYFGKGAAKPDDTSVKTFTIDVNQTALDYLNERLKTARITHDQLEDQPNFQYGFSKKALEDYKDYWQNKYDWKKAVAELMQFPHFKTEIEGLNIHFIHATPPANKYKTVKPMLASHGWPGSVHEFSKALPMLTDPAAHGIPSDFAFEVIVPSIPGYGWSDAAQKSGLNQAVVARIFAKLMDRLNFKKYFVQGGDWGSTIVGNVARLYPDRVEGCHLNMLVSANPIFLTKAALGSVAPKLFFKDAEFKNYKITDMVTFFVQNGGYLHLQAFTPDTPGIAMNDSPIGLMAWILEKFSLGTNKKNIAFEDGHLDEKFSKDDLITSVMIYWINGNFLQSVRFYKELVISKDTQNLMKEKITVPTGYAACTNDVVPAAPRELASAVTNLKHYSVFNNVGHFAMMEEPELLVKDVFAFAKPLIH